MPSFVSIDVETANNSTASICQIGMAKFVNGELVDTYNRLIRPDVMFLPANIRVHGIKPDMVKSAPKFFEVFGEVNEWLSDGVVSSHSYFDRSAIYGSIKRDILPEPNYTWIDATTVIRRTWSQYSKRGYGLANLSSDFNIKFKHHDACEDARVSGELLVMAIRQSGKSLEEWLKILNKNPKPKAKPVNNETTGSKI